MTCSHRLGELGEEIARLYLQMLGFRFLEHRFRRPGCEADLVMQEGQVVVFVEVKTRTAGAGENPAQFVTSRQLHFLRRAARHWLATRSSIPTACRFDVVAVRLDSRGQELVVQHFRSVT